MGPGAKPAEAGEFSRIFMLQPVTLHLTARLKMGSITCSPNNFVGEQMLPPLTRFPPMVWHFNV